MKLLFTSLVCHRDVDIFMFNWECARFQLDKGFDIPHLVVSDGSLTDEDKERIAALPNVMIEKDPITLYKVPKSHLLGKLECHKRGFENHSADMVVLFDCDIFFYKNWEPDLRKILQNRVTVMRDWGSSLGPNVIEYKNLFGVHEDTTTPNCNTGIIAIRKEDYNRVSEKIRLHVENPFMIMEDQGIMFAAFYGMLSYVDGIQCLITNAEYDTDIWNWALKQRGSHLMGMRTRPDGLKSLVSHSLANLPEVVPLSQFTPKESYISWGVIAYDTFNFTLPLQKIPSKCNGNHITNALYMHGGSFAQWSLPPRCNRFTTTINCMDTGRPKNVKPIRINNIDYNLGDTIDIPLKGKLEIITQDGPGAHIAFIEPYVWIDKTTKPNLTSQLTATH